MAKGNKKCENFRNSNNEAMEGKMAAKEVIRQSLGKRCTIEEYVKVRKIASIKIPIIPSDFGLATIRQ